MGSLSRRAFAWLVPALAMLLAPPGAAADDIGPTMAFTAPTGGTVSGAVGWSAAATDPSGVERVEFLVDGAIVETDRLAPYGGVWDTTRYVYGSHSLEARSFDRLGNRTAQSATVKVDSLLAPIPSVAGSVGLAGSDLLGSLALTAQIHEPLRSWAEYAGQDAPEGASMGWLQPGATTLPATITLPQTLPPGRYSLFVKGYNYGYPISARFSIGGGTATVATDDRDGNGSWSVAAPVTTSLPSNRLTLTLLKTGPAADVGKFLLRGLYVTRDAEETVLKYDTVIKLSSATGTDTSLPRPGNLIENSSFEVGSRARLGTSTRTGSSAFGPPGIRHRRSTAAPHSDCR